MTKNFPVRLRKLEREITIRLDTAGPSGQFGAADLTDDRYAYLDTP